MEDVKYGNKELLLKINVDELTPTQVRLIKAVTCLMTQVVTSDEETEYFEMSAELMKKVAEIIKHSNFPEQNHKMSYGTQAVEFAVDFLHESLDQNKIQNFDN